MKIIQARIICKEELWFGYVSVEFIERGHIQALLSTSMPMSKLTNKPGSQLLLTVRYH
jgi:hypothetical protein